MRSLVPFARFGRQTGGAEKLNGPVTTIMSPHFGAPYWANTGREELLRATASNASAFDARIASGPGRITIVSDSGPTEFGGAPASELRQASRPAPMPATRHSVRRATNMECKSRQ